MIFEATGEMKSESIRLISALILIHHGLRQRNVTFPGINVRFGKDKSLWDKSLSYEAYLHQYRGDELSGDELTKCRALVTRALG